MTKGGTIRSSGAATKVVRDRGGAVFKGGRNCGEAPSSIDADFADFALRKPPAFDVGLLEMAQEIGIQSLSSNFQSCAGPV